MMERKTGDSEVWMFEYLEECGFSMKLKWLLFQHWWPMPVEQCRLEA